MILVSKQRTIPLVKETAILSKIRKSTRERFYAAKKRLRQTTLKRRN